MKGVTDLKEQRIKKGFTQQSLAAIVGVSDSTIGMIEQGKRVPSLKVAARLATALGGTVNDIFLPGTTPNSDTRNGDAGK
jgi:DNA-binding XRE family transcriptional regulator